jgi:hypothetical protein
MAVGPLIKTGAASVRVKREPQSCWSAMTSRRKTQSPSPAGGSSNDANHMTGPSRDGAGLAQAIRAALHRADLLPQQIDYINVHGTGTPYNDAMESAAVRAVFGESIPPISGLKGMLGHTLGAAGVVETIACVLAMQEQFLPGTPRLNTIAEGLPRKSDKRTAPGNPAQTHPETQHRLRRGERRVDLGTKMKHQHPSFNLQRSSKFQAPILTRERKLEVWSLVLLRRLDVGAWSFSPSP